MEDSKLFLQTIKTPGLAHNAYILGSNGYAIIVDPRRDIGEYLQIARKNKLEIQYVFETHRQEDFVLGSAQVREITGAKVVSGKHPLSAHSDITLEDGEDLVFGDLTLRCLYTPGHTPESVSYAVYMNEKPNSTWSVFTGDALFIGAAGRTDLPDPNKTAENAGILFDSIQNKLLPLGDQTLLFPAHGSGSVCGGNIAGYDDSTIGFERTYNPAFTQTRDQFIQSKLKERIPRPPYFKLMEVLNLKGGIPLHKSAEFISVLSAHHFKRESPSGIVIDTRLPEAFAGGHIPDSFSIWLEGLPVFVGWVADDKVPVFLVLDRPEDIERAFLFLERVGVDNIAGILAGGFEAWRDAGFEIEITGTVSVESTCIDEMTVLDVRDITEYESGHVRDSKHLYVGFIPEVDDILERLDANKPLAVTCAVGHRASLAVSMLARTGRKNVFNLLGGITAWKKKNKPLVSGPDKEQTLDQSVIEKQSGKQQTGHSCEPTPTK